MAPAPGERELDEVIHRAQAALRRQESEIADVSVVPIPTLPL